MSKNKTDNSRNVEALTKNAPDDEALQRLISEFNNDLREMTPEDAVSRYLRHKADVTQRTRKEYRSKLGRFETFCENQGITDTRDLDGRLLDDYKHWLRTDASNEVEELSRKTMRDEMYLLKDFISYLETIEAVKRGINQSVNVPELKGNEGVRNVDMDPERVKSVLEYLETFEYASLSHIIWLMKAEIARRTGGFVSLDLCDVHLEADNPHVEFCHRPPEAPLKNQENSEGYAIISEHFKQTLQQYIDTVRPDVTDGSGREPLLATHRGRISTSTFRRHVYRYSRPCAIGKSCPHDREPEECEAAQSVDQGAKCPSSRSPHALRHGFISEGRREGIPLEVLSDQCDVSPETIKKHYDETDGKERLEARKEIIDQSGQNNGGGYL